MQFVAARIHCRASSPLLRGIKIEVATQARGGPALHFFCTQSQLFPAHRLTNKSKKSVHYYITIQSMKRASAAAFLHTRSTVCGESPDKDSEKIEAVPSYIMQLTAWSTFQNFAAELSDSKCTVATANVPSVFGRHSAMSSLLPISVGSACSCHWTCV